jgi:hypothetical protein
MVIMDVLKDIRVPSPLQPLRGILGDIHPNSRKK